tara:strand:- start:1654 stop:1845 length:192 start_codon:yes stop_codon:yes gene_type:complete
VRTGDLDRVEEVAFGTTVVSVVEGVGLEELPPMITMFIANNYSITKIPFGNWQQKKTGLCFSR